jgi:hypothetical protein
MTKPRPVLPRKYQVLLDSPSSYSTFCFFFRYSCTTSDIQQCHRVKTLFTIELPPTSTSALQCFGQVKQETIQSCRTQTLQNLILVAFLPCLLSAIFSQPFRQLDLGSARSRHHPGVPPHRLQATHVSLWMLLSGYCTTKNLTQIVFVLADIRLHLPRGRKHPLEPRNRPSPGCRQCRI